MVKYQMASIHINSASKLPLLNTEGYRLYYWIVLMGLLFYSNVPSRLVRAPECIVRFTVRFELPSFHPKCLVKALKMAFLFNEKKVFL